MTDYQLQVLRKIKGSQQMVFAPKDAGDESLLIRFQPQAQEILELVERKLVASGDATRVTKTVSLVTSIQISGGLTEEGQRLLNDSARRARGQRNPILVARERGEALLEIIGVLNVEGREETEAVRRARQIAVGAVLDLPAI